VGAFAYMGGKFSYSRGLATATLFAAHEGGTRSSYDNMDGLVTVWFRARGNERTEPNRGFVVPELLPIDVAHDERGFGHLIDDTCRDSPEDPLTEGRFRLPKDQEVVLPREFDDFVVW